MLQLARAPVEGCRAIATAVDLSASVCDTWLGLVPPTLQLALNCCAALYCLIYIHTIVRVCSKCSARNDALCLVSAAAGYVGNALRDAHAGQAQKHFALNGLGSLFHHITTTLGKCMTKVGHLVMSICLLKHACCGLQAKHQHT